MIRMKTSNSSVKEALFTEEEVGETYALKVVFRRLEAPLFMLLLLLACSDEDAKTWCFHRSFRPVNFTNRPHTSCPFVCEKIVIKVV